MRRIDLALGILLGIALAGSASASAISKNVSYHDDHCFGGEIKAFKHDDANMAFGYWLTGTSRSRLTDSPIGPFATQCLGAGGNNGESTSTAGHCELIDADGDKIFGSYHRRGPTGEWKALSGTGKFTGITGGGTFTRVAFPRGLMQGTFAGCTEDKGSYRLR